MHKARPGLHGWAWADDNEEEDEVVEREDADTYRSIGMFAEDELDDPEPMDCDEPFEMKDAPPVLRVTADAFYPPVCMDSSDDEDAPPVPRATDDEFDPPERMDSSDEEEA